MGERRSRSRRRFRGACSPHRAVRVDRGHVAACRRELSRHFRSFPCGEPAVYDLFGVRAEGALDQRKWLRHAAWPADVFPLRKDFKDDSEFSVQSSSNHETRTTINERRTTIDEPRTTIDEPRTTIDERRTTIDEPRATNHEPRPEQMDDYPFIRVEGEGVHEIPVGPVHAGTIEPGHFRFSIVGEGVLRLEERLGYKHKGIEKRFEQMTLAEGAKLAGRVSGDSTVAYAWAYAMAVEAVTGIIPPPRALWLRALLLERERVGQHLWDLGFLGNDAGFGFGLAQFSRLREDWLRT
ncbi:MAG: NADH-quinone oxidoreductase subunit C, partial [Betaproteobacteria bacterium]|nr:NADH-quinone oxidoreductase subunit C [Betaproteobacteria bacterium]